MKAVNAPTIAAEFDVLTGLVEVLMYTTTPQASIYYANSDAKTVSWTKYRAEDGINLDPRTCLVLQCYATKEGWSDSNARGYEVEICGEVPAAVCAWYCAEGMTKEEAFSVLQEDGNFEDGAFLVHAVDPDPNSGRGDGVHCLNVNFASKKGMKPTRHNIATNA